MDLLKLSLNLLGTHAIMSVMQIALMFPLFGILQDNQLYQWAIGLLFIAVFWFMIYAKMSYYGLEDAKSDKYRTKNGFIAGILCTIPGIILYLAMLIYNPGSDVVNWFNVALRIWLSPYIKVFNALEKYMPHPALALNMLLPLVSGFSYMSGLRKRQKILDVIEESDKQRAQKSKVGYNK